MKIWAKVTGGSIAPEKWGELRQYLTSHEGKDILIQIDRKRKPRSLAQNAYFHSYFMDEVWAMYLDKGNDFSRELCKEIIKEMFGPKRTVIQPDGRIDTIAVSTSQWTAEEAENVMDQVRAWAAQFGYTIGTPNDHLYQPLGHAV